MRHKFLVLTVKELLKSVYIYGSYRKIKTGLSLFWTTRYVETECDSKFFPHEDWRIKASEGDGTRGFRRDSK